MSLQVLDPGLYTLVIDLGRPRSRSLGVPVGGAADRASLTLGNALVGNSPDSAALEFTLAGPTLRTDTDLACVVFGAPFELTRGKGGTSETLVTGTTFTLHAGEELRIGGTLSGVRGYLCVRGGICAPVVLDSRSALAPLTAGQVLECTPGTIGRRSMHRPLPERGGPEELRVMPGAQADWFGPQALAAEAFTVTPASNRMGVRLHGTPLWPRTASSGRAGTIPEMISEPVCPGSVQVTHDGQCIILGVDGQTIGGYPKIAHVIGADLDRVGQLRPGQRLRLVEVDPEEAENAFREHTALLRDWVTRLRVTAGA